MSGNREVQEATETFAYISFPKRIHTRIPCSFSWFRIKNQSKECVADHCSSIWPAGAQNWCRLQFLLGCSWDPAHSDLQAVCCCQIQPTLWCFSLESQTLLANTAIASNHLKAVEVLQCVFDQLLTRIALAYFVAYSNWESKRQQRQVGEQFQMTLQC